MIGSNVSLSPSGSTPAQKPVLRAQPVPRPAAPQVQASQGFQSTVKQPKYIDINTTEDAVNNSLARGYQQGDQRYLMKQNDKAGLSRGKGNAFIAGQESSQAIGKAANEAAEIRGQDQLANSKMRADYERASELDALNQQMVQHSLGQSDWQRMFAQQSAQAQIAMAQQQARLQLMLSLMR